MTARAVVFSALLCSNVSLFILMRRSWVRWFNAVAVVCCVVAVILEIAGGGEP